MLAALARELASHYGLGAIELTPLDTLVNDVVVVDCATGRFVLKVYHPGRTVGAVRWETDLLLRLHAGGAPVIPPVRGSDGHVTLLEAVGARRAAVLYPWARGSKPAPTPETYHALGAAAARIHAAADGYPGCLARDCYDLDVLIEEQLARMEPALSAAGVRSTTVALGDRLRRRLAGVPLDWGVCHMDLTLDNVHVGDDGVVTVFDFDSAGLCWRAVEPWGVLRFSRSFLDDWLAGYRTVRPFSTDDEQAIAVFGIVGDFRVVAWKLGVAASSRGAPLLAAHELRAVVDDWLEWEARNVAP